MTDNLPILVGLIIHCLGPPLSIQVYHGSDETDTAISSIHMNQFFFTTNSHMNWRNTAHYHLCCSVITAVDCIGALIHEKPSEPRILVTWDFVNHSSYWTIGTFFLKWLAFQHHLLSELAMSLTIFFLISFCLCLTSLCSFLISNFSINQSVQ